jgi:hypothetical protein
MTTTLHRTISQCRASSRSCAATGARWPSPCLLTAGSRTRASTPSGITPPPTTRTSANGARAVMYALRIRSSSRRSSRSSPRTSATKCTPAPLHASREHIECHLHPLLTSAHDRADARHQDVPGSGGLRGEHAERLPHLEQGRSTDEIASDATATYKKRLAVARARARRTFL